MTLFPTGRFLGEACLQSDQALEPGARVSDRSPFPDDCLATLAFANLSNPYSTSNERSNAGNHSGGTLIRG